MQVYIYANYKYFIQKKWNIFQKYLNIIHECSMIMQC